MTEESPDWEAAARRSVPRETLELSDAVCEDCYEIADRLREGKALRTGDVERLSITLSEFDWYVENVLEPIAVDEQDETEE
ncbi:hypothetical protein [Natrinema halophilum]|uniref:Uncharacterized protein n=1 Tax=Natrinema halophilum TaxID=1699371 RepID=A0A7D5KD38_9EURY|nr:hypothetical protein [Natrinema halophilum]QLG49101.1 hypothetical protein HYG82_09680 [Natrinema halophilum]